MPTNPPTTNNAPPSGAPREADQRADVELIRDVLRFCMCRPYSRPCVVFGEVAGHLVKI